jgi:phage shock protein A
MADEPTTPATESAAEKSAASTPLPPVPTPNIDTGYTDAGVPTLEGVRDKIETRYGTALGATELAEETPEVRTAAEQYEAQHKAAVEKLDEIRASMRKPD